jgi:hypothetical protein
MSTPVGYPSTVGSWKIAPCCGGRHRARSDVCPTSALSADGFTSAQSTFSVDLPAPFGEEAERLVGA